MHHASCTTCPQRIATRDILLALRIGQLGGKRQIQFRVDGLTLTDRYKDELNGSS